MFEAVFEFIVRIVGEILFRILLWLVFWPVALLVCTPFLLLKATASALFDRASFLETLGGGYRSVTNVWKSGFDAF